MNDAEGRQARFLSALTHELRTPLGTILMLAEMIAVGQEGAKAGEHARTISALAEDMHTLIDQAGAWARIEGGRVPIEIAEIPIARFSARVESALRATLPATRPLRSEEARPLPPTIATDVRRVVAIIEAIAETVARDRVDVPVGLRIESRSEGGLAIRIHDHDDSDADEDIGSLFESFGTPLARTRRAHGGQGLGLALAARFADRLGGELVAKRHAVGLELALLLPARGPGSRAPASV